MDEIRYLVALLLVLIITLTDAVWCCLGHFHVPFKDITAGVQGMGFMLAVSFALTVIQRIPRYQRASNKLGYANVERITAWLAVILGFSLSTSVLSYLCITLHPPLIDAKLIRFDQALGFNWLGFYQWVQSHPSARNVLAFAYKSGAVQLVAVPILLGLSGPRENLSEFFFLLAASAMFLLLVSAPFPASSAFVHFGISDPNTTLTVSDFSPLRSGVKRTFGLYTMQGLVSMPSFHACLAVLFTYSLRSVPCVRIVATALNFVMILSTPTQGGHYLADVFAGLVLAGVTIVMQRRATGAARFNLPFTYSVTTRGGSGSNRPSPMN